MTGYTFISAHPVSIEPPARLDSLCCPSCGGKGALYLVTDTRGCELVDGGCWRMLRRAFGDWAAFQAAIGEVGHA